MRSILQLVHNRTIQVFVSGCSTEPHACRTTIDQRMETINGRRSNQNIATDENYRFLDFNTLLQSPSSRVISYQLSHNTYRDDIRILDMPESGSIVRTSSYCLSASPNEHSAHFLVDRERF